MTGYPSNQVVANQAPALPSYRDPQNSWTRIDGKPAMFIELTLGLPEQDERLLEWIGASYCMRRHHLINQMIGWAYYCGRADTAITKALRETARGRIPDVESVRQKRSRYHADTVNRMGALYFRSLALAQSETPRLLERVDERFTPAWTPWALTVHAVFHRYQRMFVDLCRWKPDAAEGQGWGLKPQPSEARREPSEYPWPGELPGEDDEAEYEAVERVRKS